MPAIAYTSGKYSLPSAARVGGRSAVARVLFSFLGALAGVAVASAPQ
jgi:hypothetical protein